MHVFLKCVSGFMLPVTVSASAVHGVYPCICAYSSFIVSPPEEDPVVYIFHLLGTGSPTVDT